MKNPPNVLLVILDSTRARNTSLHGYERETTPFLEEFGERSTLYTQARAPGIHSIASHVSLFTGTHVEQHQALDHTAQIDTTESIWHDLHSEFDYATGLFTNNRIVSNASNLSDCFEHQFIPEYPLHKRLENTLDNPYIGGAYFRAYAVFTGLTDRVQNGLERSERLQSLAASTSRQATKLTDTIGQFGSDSKSDGNFKTEFGGTFADGFLDWEGGQDGPWAACINLMDTHSPFTPEAEFDRWADEESWRIQSDEKPSVQDCMKGRGWDRLEALEPLYDGTIRQADAIMRDLIGELEDRGVLDDTLVIVTSDHGEGFGESSQVDPDLRVKDHKWSIHEVLTHVPLVVQYPGQTDGRVVEDVVSLTDVPDAIRATVEDGSDEALVTDDVVLASTFRLPEKKMTKYGSVDNVEAYGGPWRAVYENNDGAVRKFAQRNDDYVTVDIHAADESEIVSRDPHERVADAYEPLADDTILTERTTEIDDELEEKLEDLGYIR